MTIVEKYIAFVRCFDDEYILQQKEKKPNVDNKILYVRLVNTRAEHNEIQRSMARHGALTCNLLSPLRGRCIVPQSSSRIIISLNTSAYSKYDVEREESLSRIGTLNVRPSFYPLNIHLHIKINLVVLRLNILNKYNIIKKFRQKIYNQLSDTTLYTNRKNAEVSKNFLDILDYSR